MPSQKQPSSRSGERSPTAHPASHSFKKSTSDAVERVDLDRAIEHVRSRDGVLGAVIDEVEPFRLSDRNSDFAVLLRSVVSQQLSKSTADSILERLNAAVGSAILRPVIFVSIPVATLRQAGLSASKVRCLRSLAVAITSRQICFSSLRQMSDSEVMDSLTEVWGIGTWTSQMFLIFSLRVFRLLWRPMWTLGPHRLQRLLQSITVDIA